MSALTQCRPGSGPAEIHPITAEQPNRNHPIGRGHRTGRLMPSAETGSATAAADAPAGRGSCGHRWQTAMRFTSLLSAVS